MTQADVPELRRAEIDEILGLRHAVLRPGCPPEDAHFLADDAVDTVHFGAFSSGRNVACLSLITSAYRPDHGSEIPAWQLRGMAVVASLRNQGLGGQLLEFAAAHLDARPMWCNARLRAIPFYLRHGFEVVSEIFDVPTVGPHRKLLRRSTESH